MGDLIAQRAQAIKNLNVSLDAFHEYLINLHDKATLNESLQKSFSEIITNIYQALAQTDLNEKLNSIDAAYEKFMKFKPVCKAAEGMVESLVNTIEHFNKIMQLRQDIEANLFKIILQRLQQVDRYRALLDKLQVSADSAYQWCRGIFHSNKYINVLSKIIIKYFTLQDEAQTLTYVSFAKLTDWEWMENYGSQTEAKGNRRSVQGSGSQFAVDEFLKKIVSYFLNNNREDNIVCKVAQRFSALEKNILFLNCLSHFYGICLNFVDLKSKLSKEIDGIVSMPTYRYLSGNKICSSLAATAYFKLTLEGFDITCEKFTHSVDLKMLTEIDKNFVKDVLSKKDEFDLETQAKLFIILAKTLPDFNLLNYVLGLDDFDMSLQAPFIESVLQTIRSIKKEYENYLIPLPDNLEQELEMLVAEFQGFANHNPVKNVEEEKVKGFMPILNFFPMSSTLASTNSASNPGTPRTPRDNTNIISSGSADSVLSSPRNKTSAFGIIRGIVSPRGSSS